MSFPFDFFSFLLSGLESVSKALASYGRAGMLYQSKDACRYPGSSWLNSMGEKI